MTKKLKLIDGASMPVGLGAYGQSLWKRIMNEFDISDVGGRELLYQSARMADTAEECRAAIVRDGLTIDTKAGPRSNPLIKEELNARSFVVRTLQKLGVTLEPIKTMGRPTSQIGASNEILARLRSR